MAASIFYTYLTIVFCVISFVACKKSADSLADQELNQQSNSGLVTTVGQLLETPKTAIIGPAGGTLVSKDGHLTVTIPAGALSTETTVGIAAITNTFDAAMGLNYHITPHLELEKAATLSFSYKGIEDSLSAVGLTGICFQDEQGVWQLKSGSQFDSEQKTISVETNHFSDWALARIVRLTPSKALILPDESVKITPLVCIPLKGINDLAKIFITGAPDIPLVKPYELPQDYVVDTFVIGDESVEGMGTLTATGENSIIYTASSDVNPKINPVTLVYTLTNTPMVLQAKIQVVVNTTGVTITLGGKTYQYDNAYATVESGHYTVVFQAKNQGNAYHGSIDWYGNGEGSYSWSDDNQFLWIPEGLSPRRAYQHVYQEGVKISAGKVVLNYLGDGGELLIGEFVIANAGATDVETGDATYLGDAKITGSFMVRIAID
ncbi:hypothetical protein GCM10023231_29190 [Olivibacter ginsenosidimutans]|uniref:ZU5 domain-containing protein n=2 Tax=Olivibacter ginsenosidimutans TaxID=1176537 RepID=A0ABP9BPE4_9SPHI